MEFTHRYFGASTGRTSATETALTFAPDTLREPAFFTGRVAKPLAFREAISALHHVVVADQRFKPRDIAGYLAWLKEHEQALLIEFIGNQPDTANRIETLRQEIYELQAARHRARRPFYDAREAYFNWLYRNDRDAWIVFDPIISIHPDEISFECFSRDELTYARLSCDHETFSSHGEMVFGTTNIDYSQALYEAFQKIRSYRETVLAIDPGGFTVATDDMGLREAKIDLPNSWLRGLLQVSSAMTLPARTFELHPMDMANILTRLAQRKERAGPRSLRFVLTPEAPVSVVLEPWNETLQFRRSIYHGSAAAEIRVWGRWRLALLARTLPLAERIRVHLLGSGLPSFFIVDFGGLRLTLGLSGWTANDWSRVGRFDLLAPRHVVDPVTAERIFAALGAGWYSTAGALAAGTGLSEATVHAAMTGFCQAGRVLYDLDKGVYRHRDLTRQPLDLSVLRLADEREVKAERFIEARLVRIEGIDRAAGRTSIRGTVLDDGHDRPTSLTLDADDRLVQATCGCDHFTRNKLMRGPCEHMLAVRRIFHAQVEGVGQRGGAA